MVSTSGGLFPLTEELFVLVKGNIIRWDEFTTEGHVNCAVTLACTCFWRSVLTSKTASILLKEKTTSCDEDSVENECLQNRFCEIQTLTCLLMPRALFQLFPSSEEFLVEVHISIPDILLQSQSMWLGLSCRRQIFTFKSFDSRFVRFECYTYSAKPPYI